MERRKIWLAWSSGKDSVWALHRLRQAQEYEIVALLVTLNREFRRVSMHGVREEIVEAQARAVGLPLVKVWLPYPCPNRAYEEAMSAALRQAAAAGVSGIAFGDLFLEDVRRYREAHLQDTGIEPLFPLWQEDTSRLARQMIQSGLEAYLVCVDGSRMDPAWAGRRYDQALLEELPGDVDPCGERGEFHTLVVAAPDFDKPVAVWRGETVQRDGYTYVDFVLAAEGGGPS